MHCIGDDSAVAVCESVEGGWFYISQIGKFPEDICAGNLVASLTSSGHLSGTAKLLGRRARCSLNPSN